MTFRPSGLVRGRFKLFSTGVAACALWACISDGPNRTGGDYLNDGGITLDAPLHHFTFADFPIDTTFTEDFTLSHEGDSFLVVGQESPYRASARLGYQLNSVALRHKLAEDTVLHLRVAKPALATNGGAFLTSSTAGRDSITLVVESFSLPNISGKVLSDSLNYHHRRIISASAVPFSTLPDSQRTRDTARIALAAAFTTDSSDPVQALPLPHLRRRLASDTAHNWLVYVEISPLAGSADSGLFRFRGMASREDSANYNPALLLGAYVEGDTSTKPVRVHPYPTAVATQFGTYYLLAVNYQVTHNDKSQSLLYGVSRGLHLRLDRQALLDSIYGRLGTGLPSESGRFATEFFVPYAELTLPLADTLARVDGPFALDMRLTTDLDSVLPGQTIADTLPIALGDSIYLLSSYTISDVNRRYPTDSLYCSYRQNPLDTSMRQVLFQWRKDSRYNDTLTLEPDGNRREFSLHRLASQVRPQKAALSADPDRVRLEMFFSIGNVEEPNALLDTAGAILTSPSNNQARFWKPGASRITLRSTMGFRTLLNRRADSGLAPDFYIRPAEKSAYDTSGFNSVNYPVLGKIDFPRVNGRIRATVNIYLFPLGRR